MFKRKLSDAENLSLPTKRQRWSSDVKVQLLDKELWNRFHALTNEMIVTKSGRRMFPVIRAGVTGLDPEGMYRVSLRFKGTNAHRWRFVNGQWRSNHNGQIVTPKNTAYEHRYSPNFGKFWMSNPISFTTLRLTNRQEDDGRSTDKISLNTLHKYTPELLITKVEAGKDERIVEVSFPPAEFIAVTAYQNEQITALKIRHNPFAKAFLNINDRPMRCANSRGVRREENSACNAIASYHRGIYSGGSYSPAEMDSSAEIRRESTGVNWSYLPCLAQSMFAYPSTLDKHNFDSPMHQSQVDQINCYLRSIDNVAGPVPHLDSTYFDSCYSSLASICDQPFK